MAAVSSQVVVGLSTSGKLFFGTLCGTTFYLGCWQSQRYYEKKDLLKKRQDDLQKDPLQLDNIYSNNNTNNNNNNMLLLASSTKLIGTPSFQRYTVKGKYSYKDELLVGPRGPPPGILDKNDKSGQGMSSSPQGYYVITPLDIIIHEEEEDDHTTNEKTNNGSSYWWPWSRTRRKDITESNSMTTTTTIESNNNNNQKRRILINRGWIPRHFVINSNNNQKRRNNNSNNNNNDNNDNETSIIKWNRPTGIVEIVGIPSKVEQPRFLKPQHSPVKNHFGGIDGGSSVSDSNETKNAKQKLLQQQLPQQLYFFDGTTLEDLTNIPKDNLILLTQISDDDTSSKNKNKQFPISSPLETIGEYKTTPSIHAGYAVTWFGLSGAGLYMTRKLITRGR